MFLCAPIKSIIFLLSFYVMSLNNLVVKEKTMPHIVLYSDAEFSSKSVRVYNHV